MEHVIEDAENRMTHAVEHLKHDLNGFRTGRANPAILEKIMVDYYGTPTPLNQVANISVPEARQLLIQPYDRNMITPIEKSIQRSDLGVNPQSDGQVIRINLPALTEERRKDLVKQVHKRVEEGRVAVRNVRRDAMDHLKQMQKNKTISEDDLKRYEHQVDKVTHKYVELCDKAQTSKEQELMEI
ncbi:MAG: ribosome recycling factor [Fimbriimonadia bacterium]|nr:ribosome recycling factor [Fimbriimonadia bacterium]